MEKRQYSVEKVLTSWVCRPAGQLGTCGWYPYPWTACFGSTPSKALENFKREHPNEPTPS